MKTVKLKKPWHDLIMSMDVNDITNSYYGSCNLTANYLDDYSEKATNDLIFESFVEGELLENPDIILQNAASTIVSCLDCLKLADNLEKLLVHGKCGDKLDILKSGECFYIVNTTEKPENAFNDLLDSLDADNQHLMLSQ